MKIDFVFLGARINIASRSRRRHYTLPQAILLWTEPDTEEEV
jgi:hypothetical protein